MRFKLFEGIPSLWRIVIIGLFVLWFGVLCFGVKTTFFQEKQQEENSITIKVEKPEQISCDKCETLMDAWGGIGFSIQNIEGIPDMNYCKECTAMAIIWVMENSFTIKK